MEERLIDITMKLKKVEIMSNWHKEKKKKIILMKRGSGCNNLEKF